MKGDDGRAAGPGGGREVAGVGEGGVEDDDAGAGVVQHMLQFAGRVGDGERHGDRAGRPDAELQRDVGPSRGDQAGHALAGEAVADVAGLLREPCGPGQGLAVEVAVAARSPFIHHRNPACE